MTASQQAREKTPEENFRELYKRMAELNDKVAALLSPAWGSEMGLLPTDHPLYQGEEPDPDSAASTAPDLTAEEARALVDELGLQLYRAQDALAFVAECCDIADREQRTIMAADVREWLKGARCGRQLAADATTGSYTGRAEQAEAAINRVRAVVHVADDEDVTDWQRGFRACSVAALRALNEAAPAATEATGHPYLSTGCLHGHHDYCQAMTGHAGAKRPGQCKFCAAPCLCSCHQSATGEQRPA